MKNAIVMTIGGLMIASSLIVTRGYGIDAFKKEFEAKYVKKDPTTDAEKALAAAVTKVKCNVCHVGKNKKARNEYGKALDHLLDKKKDAKNKAKIQSALDEVANMKSDPKDDTSPSFGELIQEGKLPGGEESAK